jgi:hypothetical protein
MSIASASAAAVRARGANLMRPNRLRLRAIAAWLGVIALGLNALVPVHLAFDLAHALEPGARHATRGAEHGFEWRVLALLTGHHDDADKFDDHGKHHHTDCAVCSSLGTLAGFAPATIVLLSVPLRIEAPVLIAVTDSAPRAAPTAAYRSRAPPIVSADSTT